MCYSFYYPPENKVFVARNVEFFENSLITQEASESLEDLELIQEEDTHPSENTSSHHDEGDREINEPQNIRAIRILIAIAAYYNYEVWQMDVKTAFLNGYIFEDVYMEQPEETKYIAASDASKEEVWVRKFIDGLGVVPTIKKPIKMYCDNTGAITIAIEPGINKGARHYHAKVYYLSEVIEYATLS
uniref:Putative retrotransposon protein n=1 Tax=Tanacetum cinerariifolium TaxID=118510 RepID=A0A6L2MXL8_TANCI|nr:putative retrotransposon protein [Tanacetum cinerariifolium]